MAEFDITKITLSFKTYENSAELTVIDKETCKDFNDPFIINVENHVVLDLSDETLSITQIYENGDDESYNGILNNENASLFLATDENSDYYLIGSGDDRIGYGNIKFRLKLENLKIAYGINKNDEGTISFSNLEEANIDEYNKVECG